MVLAMLLAGLRRCTVLVCGSATCRSRTGGWSSWRARAATTGWVPAANRFFDALGAYLHDGRPEAARTERVFVVLKGPRHGLPLSAEGVDEILVGDRPRVGLEHATCHELGTRA